MVSTGKQQHMAHTNEHESQYVLAFDCANEVIACAVGLLHAETKTVSLLAGNLVLAHRSSNTKLLTIVDGVLKSAGVSRKNIACVCVGRGPGSFTGVRIALACAKGVASALGVALVGVSTLDAVAHNAALCGFAGKLVVLADAMRGEVYPVAYEIVGGQAERLTADTVLKAQAAAEELRHVLEGSCAKDSNVANATTFTKPFVEQGCLCAASIQFAGDGLKKYSELFEPYGTLLPSSFWYPTAKGLLAALQAAWQAGTANPFDKQRHQPALLLPVYTRLSDAEENERIRLAQNNPKNLRTGVQDVSVRADQRPTMHDSAILNAKPNAQGIVFKPLDSAHAAQVAKMEASVMGSDAWNASMVEADLQHKNRTWWMASVQTHEQSAGSAGNDKLIGYCGGLVVDGRLEILKVVCAESYRRRGVAKTLFAHVLSDARDLGARSVSLEVRTSNAGARAFYEAFGMQKIGERKHYYSDGEAAAIYSGSISSVLHLAASAQEAKANVAGMNLQVDDAFCAQAQSESTSECSAAKGLPSPVILAIESSCDETAAAIVCGGSKILADVVASQIDFHSRFGGVVPEIASRKHVEAICGVCDECFDVASKNLATLSLSNNNAQAQKLTWENIDAVAVTYAPGLVGALVVGVAFAKGAAWARNLPLICVNHMEGHLYANKIGEPSFEPPAVVSLVSGGNTMLVHMKDWGNYKILGETIDDAVGEAFDKVAKTLGLGYPGGPEISKLAASGNPKAVNFPRALMHSHDFRFSLSGLKTAVVTYINAQREAGVTLNLPDICASFEAAVVDVQVKKANMALDETGAPTFCLGGGVAANPTLRRAYEQMCDARGVKLIMPPAKACTDNAAMVALVALDRYAAKKFANIQADALAHASLEDEY